MAIRFRLFLLPMLAGATAASSIAQPTVESILNAASYSNRLAPGTWGSIFGSKLSLVSKAALSVPLPYTLGGVSVTVDGVEAPLNFVSPNQINFLIPFESSLGAKVPVVVTTSEGAGAPMNIPLVRDAPALFTQNGEGTGMALAFEANFRPLASVGSSPIVLYATGLGPTNPAPVSSALGGSATEPFNRVEDQVQVLIGEVPGTVVFAGLAPGLPGIFQVNVIPPPNPQSNRLYVSVNGTASSAVTLPIPVGTNVTNVTGTIYGMYPASGIYLVRAENQTTSGPVAFSAMLTAAAFTAEFDIVPSAKPFTVTAVGRAGGAVLQIDPGNQTCLREITTPSVAARQYDFSGTWLQVYDLHTGLPFPGDQVPVSLLDPMAWQALNLVPLPDMPGLPPQGTPNYSALLGCPAPQNGHFSIGIAGFVGGGVGFGGFMDIGVPPPSTLTATFLLFVDGALVASKDVPYQVY